jgi:transcriptional regulator with XRE-family HTH domain
MKVSRPDDIGAIIKGYRALRGLSQAQLAERLQTTQKWISHIENGKATAHIGLILRALNELGFSISIERENETPSVRHQPAKSAQSDFSIDDIVDE